MKIIEIPFFNFLDAPEDLRREWRSAINEVIKTGRFIGGKHVSDFESEWADYLGTEFAVGVGNGYDAIVLSLRALEIGPGSKVGVPAHTFIATWLAVHEVGATPVGIDCDYQGLMNLDALFNLEVELDAVIPVHMHGQMVAMDKLIPWAVERGVKVIEDCAQAHGAEINGKKAGTWGDIGAFSFYPTKNLGAIGDAGAIATNKFDLAKNIRSLGNYGSRVENKYAYDHLGQNSRLDPLQAAILSVNLKYLDSWNQIRRSIAHEYLAAAEKLNIQPLSKSMNSVWHHFILMSNNQLSSIEILGRHGVATDRHYPQSAANNYYEVSNQTKQDFPIANEIASKTLSIPISPWMTAADVNQVIQVLSLESVRTTFF
jgi:dTDP-4-amino-4,6-dideoxygalactose transaminase